MNFNVSFSNSTYLLLLIPALALALLLFFKADKFHRSVGNRFLSSILHLCIMALAISLLAGIAFEYDETDDTEVILLVDSSMSADGIADKTEAYLKTFIKSCSSTDKLGIVKFGYDQVYAHTLAANRGGALSDYFSSPNPDTSGTNIASALTYSASLFTNPESSRIVLISDALETDSEASTVIKSLSASGIHVDTVYFPAEALESEVQIIGAESSVSKVKLDSKFDINLTLQSSIEGEAVLQLYDNGIQQNALPITLTQGIQTITIPYEFAFGGLHTMTYEISAETDTIEQNNRFISYFDIPTFSNILVIESIDDESRQLSAIMGERLEATVLNITNGDELPATLDELREYDEVILLNVSNAQLQMHEGFDLLLQQYVQEIGGGLFTICGNTEDSTQENWTANAYTRVDMYGTVYQDMLPVEIVNYTPPAGVIVIVDASGSMLNGGKYEGSKLYYALDGARACLDALTERDYLGIMTLSDSYTEELELTSCVQRDKILSSIDEIEHDAINGILGGGGTIYSAAFERAFTVLSTRTDLDKKHIILVTDGEPSSADTQDYLYACRELMEAGITITMSICSMDASSSAEELMKNILLESGNTEDNYHNVLQGQYGDIVQIMRDDLFTPKIKEINYETFVPTIQETGSVTNGVLQEDMPTLDGYYGVKLKTGATAYLMGQYTPIYAQWEYGKGRVGTFACDLNGTWSSDFLESETGALLINNIIHTLLPSEDIRSKQIALSYKGENYTTNLSIITNLNPDEKIQVTVSLLDGSESKECHRFLLSCKEDYSRLSFSVKESGIYAVEARKLGHENQELASETVYRCLSYSKEYLAFQENSEAQQLMQTLSEETDGVNSVDAGDIFAKINQGHTATFEPHFLFCIMIAILFLIVIKLRFLTVNRNETYGTKWQPE